jgi:predicted TPR repeat methyltransferase
MLDGRRYGRAIELGCGAGAFTRLVAPRVERMVASDVAPAAIERARSLGLPNVEFRVENAMDRQWHAEGPWDLFVFNDTICYLGWRYSFFDVAWFAHEVYEATAPGGRYLMANTMNEQGDYLLLPFVVRTYRDLFLNVGFRLENEDTFTGTRNGVEFKVLESLFAK